MRIALFSDTYLPTVNGVARTLGKLVAHAAARGHQLFLVTPRVSDDQATGSTHHHQLPGIPLPMYPELQISRWVDRSGNARLRAFAPDIVHVATEAVVGWSGRQWAVWNDVPLVTSFHTNFPEYVAGYGLGALEEPLWRFLRFFHSRARLTFCPSHATLGELRSRGFHDRLRIWPRGVDTAQYTPARWRAEVRERLAPATDHVLLYVGRLAPEKRPALLLEAFAQLRETWGARVGLVIVGDGPSAAELKKSAPDGVTFTGYLRGDELADAYAACDAFVFPSDTETFGNVVLEAQASGLPVIAPARGGVTDLVRPGGNGLLVPPRDASAIARACRSLLGDEAKRMAMGTAARAFALTMSWDGILDRLLADYVAAVDPAWSFDTAGLDARSGV